MPAPLSVEGAQDELREILKRLHVETAEDEVRDAYSRASLRLIWQLQDFNDPDT